MPLESATIRDYGGGWNVADSDMNLSSRFQPISDNVDRGVDGSFYPRFGTEFVCDFKNGVETVHAAKTVTLTTVETQPYVQVAWTSHGFSSGDHVTISGATAVGGISADSINGTHGILVINASAFRIPTIEAATGIGSSEQTLEFVHDTHLLAGEIIHETYFNRKLLVFTDIGEIGTRDDENNLARIWDYGKAEVLSTGLIPTRRCLHWSTDTFKSSVIACNGYDRDKPLQIFDDFRVEFLIDKATLSNAAVPKADYVVCMQGFVIFIRTEFGDPFIELSAKGTDGTFTREAIPADAVEVDLSMITSTVEPVLLGGAKLRDKLYVAFYDRGMIGTLNIYNDASLHDPDFNDTISEHGTVSHRTLVALGNDVFMCDYAGVPSVGISQQSGIFVPVRLSELISPAIQRHLAHLSEETLKYKAYAVYNRTNRAYMLFLPIYDEETHALPQDPLLFNDSLCAQHHTMINFPNHNLIENSHVTIAGAPDVGGLAAANINGVRKVTSIVDKNTVVVELGGSPTDLSVISGGGSSMTITPVNDEMIGYIFEYNKEFKLRRWTRYRGWNFSCACTSQRGRLFFAKGLRIYRMGDNERPLYADFIGEYDAAWSTSTAYVVGDRVLDTVTGDVYHCDVAHTSAVSGTFAEYRAANLDIWSLYVGEPIEWAMETPWSDMRQRDRNKVNKYINLDTEGTDRFTVGVFVNKLRTCSQTNVLRPAREMQFHAGNTGGFNVQLPGNWGSGRRTREEKVWPFEFRGKLIRWRYSGSTTQRVRIVSHTMYYKLGGNR